MRETEGIWGWPQRVDEIWTGPHGVLLDRPRGGSEQEKVLALK